MCNPPVLSHFYNTLDCLIRQLCVNKGFGFPGCHFFFQSLLKWYFFKQLNTFTKKKNNFHGWSTQILRFWLSSGLVTGATERGRNMHIILKFTQTLQMKSKSSTHHWRNINRWKWSLINNCMKVSFVHAATGHTGNTFISHSISWSTL